MKKLTAVIGKNFLTLIGTLAVLTAMIAATSASTVNIHQPECPEELLK